MKTFKTHLLVQTQHVDSTGIVHFPRYIEMAHSVVEQWFDEALDHGFAQFHGSDNAALPVGQAEMRFPAPSRLGDSLVWRLQVKQVGQSSLALALTASCGGEVRAEMTLVFILSEMGVMRPRRWPEQLRLRAKDYLIEKEGA